MNITGGEILWLVIGIIVGAQIGIFGAALAFMSREMSDQESKSQIATDKR